MPHKYTYAYSIWTCNTLINIILDEKRKKKSNKVAFILKE